MVLKMWFLSFWGIKEILIIKPLSKKSHFDFFPKNLGDYNEEPDEKFDQDLKRWKEDITVVGMLK